MDTKLTIAEFVKLGGKIENLDLEKEAVIATTRFDKVRVTSITLCNKTNGMNEPLYYVNKKHTLHGAWITIIADVVLHPRYTTPKETERSA